MHLAIEIYRYKYTDINGKGIKEYQYCHLK